MKTQASTQTRVFEPVNPALQTCADPHEGEGATALPQRLRVSDLLIIDRALHQVGERGEVRLIIERGRLRFLQKVMVASLERGSTSPEIH